MAVSHAYILGPRTFSRHRLHALHLLALYQVQKLNHTGLRNVQKIILSAVTNGPRIESFTQVEVIGVKNKKTIIVRTIPNLENNS